MSSCFGGGKDSSGVSPQPGSPGVSYDDVFGKGGVARPASAVNRKKLYRKPSEETVRDYNRLGCGRVKSFSSGTVNGQTSDSYRIAREQMRGKGDTKRRKNGDFGGISLDYLLQNEVAVEMFHEFCEHMLVPEELGFWTEVEMFQNAQWKAFSVLGVDSSRLQILKADLASGTSALLGGLSEYAKKHEISPSEVEIHQGAHHIWNTYLSEEAESQVCLSSECMHDIKAKILAGTLNRGIFRRAQRETFRDMERGIFTQFLQNCSSEDLKWMEVEMSKQTKNSPALATVMAAVRVRRRSLGVKGREGSRSPGKRPSSSPASSSR